MDKKGAQSTLMRGAQDLFACTVLCARQRRVKLTLELSFLRRASRWSAPSAKPRRRVSGTPTRTIKANRSATFATCDRYVTRVDPTRQYFIIFVSSHPDPNTRGAPFRSSLPAVASASNAVRMGQIQANWLGRSSRRARGTAGRVANERCAISASSLFLSPCPTNIYRHDNFLSQAVSSRLTSFEFHILRRSGTSKPPRGRRA